MFGDDEVWVDDGWCCGRGFFDGGLIFVNDFVRRLFKWFCRLVWWFWFWLIWFVLWWLIFYCWYLLLFLRIINDVYLVIIEYNFLRLIIWLIIFECELV